MISMLRQLFIFVREFGLHGLTLFLRYLSLRFGIGSEIQVLNIPKIKNPVHLRKLTSDCEVFFQIFVQRGYDFSGFHQNSYLEQTYETAVSKHQSPVIIDCGANIGLSSIWYASRYPAARVFAIEPDRGNFTMLCRNTKSFPNIVPIHAAVWDKETTLTVVDKAAAAWAFQIEEGPADNEIPLPVITIPTVMAEAKADQILWAKIDIEGGEQALFRSNIAWLEWTTGIAIELHDWMLPGAGSSRNFLIALGQYPFEVVWRGETMFCVKKMSHQA